MRRPSPRFILTLLVFFVLFYFLLPYEWFGHRPKGIKYFYEHERPQIFVDSCQFTEVPLTGAEGEFQHEDFKLRGLLVAFRHGERSPIHSVDSKFVPDCIPYQEVDRRAFDTYARLLKSADFRSFLSVDPNYPKFTWHPHPYKCRNGEMTAEGALQLIKLGTHLHDRYERVGLFADINKADILFTSSPYQRTFQSAIAFSSAFFYIVRDLPKLFLRNANNTYFCMDAKCDCPKYLETRRAAETASGNGERSEDFWSRSPRNLYNRIQALGNMVGMKFVEHPLQFEDIMLGRFICRRNTLPCNAVGDCFTVNDFVETADEVWSIAKRMFERTSPITRSLYVIEAWTMLGNLRAAIRTARDRAQGSKVIRVYSGHDITLEPLLHVLGIGHRIPPHYSSRIVFELYEIERPRQGETIFVRVLFNGRDHTEDVEFCRPLVKGLCRGSHFEDFAEKGVLALQSLQSIREICH
ncbi:Acid phosphatase-like protein 2 [Aphelenchoides fujianensis]|nr:Acid phosphatase-like protein 2 [Aphelenchoides fujianensis]